MTQLNSNTIAANLHKGTSELASRTFTEAFSLLGKAFNQRMQIERNALGDAFEADVFWHDNELAESVIQSAIKKPALKNDGSPKMRKGNPVFETSRMNQRVIASAAAIVRRGVRSVRALEALNRKSVSIEDAVKQADQLGGILGMVRRLAQAGLVADNKAANTAKNAAISAWENGGETPRTYAQRALIGSLSGNGEMKVFTKDVSLPLVTSAQFTLVRDALTQFGEDLRTARKIVTDSRPLVAPQALTFAGIFGIVIPITRKPRNRKPVVQPDASENASTGTDGQ
jgi:hypothetical protein